MKDILLAKLLLSGFVACLFTLPALARPNDISISDGMGEELQIKNGFLGNNSKIVKDQFGNGYRQEKGLFGDSKSQVNVLGNSVKHKKGVFGSSEFEGSTIFGDKLQSKKGLFGRRKTNIDLSGTANVVRSLFTHPKYNPALDNYPEPYPYIEPAEQ